MATKPTQADIEAYANSAMQRLGITPPADTLNEHTKAHLQKQYDELRQRQLHNAEVALTRQYEREQALEAERAQVDQQKLDAQVDQLRRNFLAQPGATEREFDSVLPDLLTEQRKQAALTGQTRFAEQVAEAKRRVGRML